MKSVVDGWARLSVPERAKALIVDRLSTYPPQARSAFLVRALVEHSQDRPGTAIRDRDIADIAGRLGLDGASIIEAYVSVTKAS